MSLHRHLQTYIGDWMPKINELNQLFLSRPPMEFTVYPEEDVVVGRPLISPILIKSTLTRVPNSTEVMLMVDYYREKQGYQITYTDENAFFFDTDPTVYYPAEVIYVNDIESHSMYLPNRFTIVL